MKNHFTLENHVKEAIAELKAAWDEEGEPYTEAELKLMVFENLRDELKWLLA
jgi:hypothetical protein